MDPASTARAIEPKTLGADVKWRDEVLNYTKQYGGDNAPAVWLGEMSEVMGGATTAVVC